MKYVALWLEGAGKSGNITTAGPSVGGRIRMVHLSHSEVGINTQTRSFAVSRCSGQDKLAPEGANRSSTQRSWPVDILLRPPFY